MSLLENGETQKAFDLFMLASKGVLTESFLRRIILQQNSDDYTHNQAMTQYYLKVITLFQQHSALDYVIELAKSAIGILDKNDSQMVRLFFIYIFRKHVLQLKLHFDTLYYFRQCFSLLFLQIIYN